MNKQSDGHITVTDANKTERLERCVLVCSFIHARVVRIYSRNLNTAWRLSVTDFQYALSSQYQGLPVSLPALPVQPVCRRLLENTYILKLECTYATCNVIIINSTRRSSSVSIETRLRAGLLGNLFRSPAKAKIFLFPQLPDPSRVPCSLHSNAYWRYFPADKTDRAWSKPSPISSIKSSWSYACSPPYTFTLSHLGTVSRRTPGLGMKARISNSDKPRRLTYSRTLRPCPLDLLMQQLASEKAGSFLSFS
jgi:hypothetical protein